MARFLIKLTKHKATKFCRWWHGNVRAPHEHDNRTVLFVRYCQQIAETVSTTAKFTMATCKCRRYRECSLLSCPSWRRQHSNLRQNTLQLQWELCGAKIKDCLRSLAIYGKFVHMSTCCCRGRWPSLAGQRSGEGWNAVPSPEHWPARLSPTFSLDIKDHSLLW